MVWVYGGSFNSGGTNNPSFDGLRFIQAHDDVVLVSVGYRVGIMGFIDFANSGIPGGTNYPDSGNLGLPGAYQAIAEMINRYNVSCRNVDAFAMDEWADEDGNVAPLTYGAGLGYSFRNHFYGKIREDLRPDVEHWHVFTNENKGDNVYSSIIEEVGGGGADVVYSATGWPGHTAFIDPGAPEFHADTLEEFCKLGSRITSETPLTICENSLFSPMGASGDVWAVPPRAATIGPRDIVNARERFELHNFCNPGGDSWQRMISRLELYGPISMDCPASIMRLGKGVCYVSEALARPFGSWYNQIEDWKL